MIVPHALRLPALAFLLGGVALFWFASTDSVSYYDADPSYNRAYWAEQFSQHDGRAVYREFKERNQSQDFERQHLSAHLMGELIYTTYGIEGIAVCDPSFSYGCYHGFFGRAISEGGDARVAELDAACLEAFGPLGTGCQHGIGHGVLEYVGYDRVNDALKLCGETTYVAPLLGCASGVFMEYNTPLIGVDEALVPRARQVTEDTLYEPCDSVPSRYQPACYYQLGEWSAPQYRDDFSRINDICAALTGSAREHCFLGAGAGVAPVLGYSLLESLARCASANGADERACRAGISWALYASPDHRINAAAACAYEDVLDERACRTLADLTQGKAPR